jgi:hypothetical protein
MARSFPTGLQDLFLQTPGPLQQGAQYAHDPLRDLYLNGIIRQVDSVSQEFSIAVTYGSAGNFGFTIDGLAIVAAASVDSDTSAAALNTAIQAYITAYGTDFIASSSVVGNDVAVVMADDEDHTIGEIETGTTTIVITDTEDAASYAKLTYGLGVTLDEVTGFDLSAPYLRAIRGATSGSDELIGVLGYELRQSSAFQRLALGYGELYLPPGNPYRLIVKGSVVVPWVGTLPTGPSSSVYWINDPATLSQRGKFRSDANGGEADLVSGFIEGVIPELSLVKVKFDL